MLAAAVCRSVFTQQGLNSLRRSKLILMRQPRTGSIFMVATPGTAKPATSRHYRRKTSRTIWISAPSATAIDVLVGGPPCQAFARVGRSKLREIDEHPQAFKHDPRARLYLEYLRYVAAFQPLAVLMENVPDVLNHGGQNIAEEICEVLEEKGYVCALHAAERGLLRRAADARAHVSDRLTGASLPVG